MNIIKYYPYSSALYSWKDLKVSSTTLFGALSNMWVLLYGEKEIGDFFEAYANGDILFSSMFPFFYGKEEILFYPRPILNRKATDSEREVPTQRIKELKKVKFLSEKLTTTLLNSIRKDGPNYYYTYSLLGENIEFRGIFAFESSEDIFPPAYNFIELPHVNVDRFNISHEGEGGVFYIEDLAIEEGIGFYFLCSCEQQWKEKLYPLFRLMADEGIGGNRSTGRGTFKEVQIENYTPPEIEDRGIYLGLSLVFPKKEELSAIYTLSLEKDDGFVYYGRPVSLKKSPIYLIKEGAIYNDKIKGCVLEEEGEGLKIYRNGMAFLLGGER